MGHSAQPGFGFPRGADLVYRCSKGYTRRDNVAKCLVKRDSLHCTATGALLRFLTRTGANPWAKMPHSRYSRKRSFGKAKSLLDTGGRGVVVTLVIELSGAGPGCSWR